MMQKMLGADYAPANCLGDTPPPGCTKVPGNIIRCERQIKKEGGNAFLPYSYVPRGCIEVNRGIRGLVQSWGKLHIWCCIFVCAVLCVASIYAISHPDTCDNVNKQKCGNTKGGLIALLVISLCCTWGCYKYQNNHGLQDISAFPRLLGDLLSPIKQLLWGS